MTEPNPSPTPEKFNLLNEIQKSRKAIVSAVVAGVVTLVAVYPNGISSDEWGQVIIAVIVGAGLTWAIPNKRV